MARVQIWLLTIKWKTTAFFEHLNVDGTTYYHAYKTVVNIHQTQKLKLLIWLLSYNVHFLWVCTRHTACERTVFGVNADCAMRAVKDDVVQFQEKRQRHKLNISITQPRSKFIHVGVRLIQKDSDIHFCRTWSELSNMGACNGHWKYTGLSTMVVERVG